MSPWLLLLQPLPVGRVIALIAPLAAASTGVVPAAGSSAAGAVCTPVSMTDLAARPPRGLADGEVLDLGGKRVRHLATPHVPQRLLTCCR